MAECRVSELMSWRAVYSGNACCVEFTPTSCAWPASLTTICHASRTDELRTGSLIKDAGTETLRAQPEAGLKAPGGLNGWFQDPTSGVVADRRHGEKWA